MSAPLGFAQPRRKPLAEFVALKRGYDLPSQDRNPGSIPILGSFGITGWHNCSKHDGPGVSIGRSGASIGVATYTRLPYWPLNTTLYVTDFKGNDPRFVYYVLDSIDFSSLNSGGAIPSLNRNYLGSIEVPDLPLQTQRKIVAILSAYDDLIENNNHRINLLEEMPRLIYREWFVDFRYPGRENSPLVDSDLGAIPPGWSVGRISDHADVIRGRSYRGEDVVDEGGIPFINLKCVARDGGFRPDGIKRYSGDFRAAHKVQAGDIVMAVTDMTQERRIVARAARVPDLGEEFGVFSMDLVKIVSRDLPAEYILGLLRYSNFPDQVKAYANGANVLHLHPDRISDYRAPFPPRPIVLLYSEQVAPMQHLTDGLYAVNGRLRAARDLLLPCLISGKVDVADLDIAMAEAPV